MYGEILAKPFASIKLMILSDIKRDNRMNRVLMFKVLGGRSWVRFFNQIKPKLIKLILVATYHGINLRGKIYFSVGIICLILIVILT